ncbi:MAG: hypothetical protein ABL921_34405 [Pirellula sp.]
MRNRVMVEGVFRLQPVLDDPRFDGLLFETNSKAKLGGSDPWDDFEPQKLPSGEWTIRELANSWIDVETVKGPVRSFNDYPCVNLDIPAFSARAAKALGPLLKNNGELLPLQHKNGRYFAFNLRNVSDVLRPPTTEFQRDSTNMIVRIVWYDFYKSKIKDLTIFRTPQYPFEILVTDTFKKRVEECGLNGFNFIKVWPLPKGVDWRDLETKARKNRSTEYKLTGETLILRFRLKGDKPTPTEKKKLAQYDEQLMDLLESQTSMDDPYDGSLDASEYNAGEYRIFLSCPSVDRLTEVLEDWMAANDWPNEFHIVKRWGHLMDTKAKEKRIAMK